MKDAQQRFLPTRFTPKGQALDAKGVVCQDLACPSCHLTVSRALLEMQPLFLSILGAQSSGKSYFLSSMIWKLRRALGRDFSLSFGDADPDANSVLTQYEETLFLNPRADEYVELRKTELEGELYEGVTFGERVVYYPRPFVFSIQPLEKHPGARHQRRLARSMCLYDNAGEHFEPGRETATQPGTQHLALSQALLFLFDPTQHRAFRRACNGKTNDPQMRVDAVSYRQDQVLMEAASRIRRQSGLGQHDKYANPLIVVVTKYDAWSALTGQKQLKTSWVIRQNKGSVAALDVKKLKQLSEQVRSILEKYSPEIITAAESFSKDVIYIPVSAMGGGPTLNEKTGKLLYRPQDVRPMWVEVPFLYALHRSVKGLIGRVESSS